MLLTLLDVCDKILSTKKKRRNTQQEAQKQLEWNLFLFFGKISFWKWAITTEKEK